MSSPDAQRQEPTRLWGGRFEGSPSAEMDRLNRSLPVDRRLWREDILGSRAWASALVRAGVLTANEGTELDAGLQRVEANMARFTEGEWDQAPDEDIHSLVERLLREEIGPLAGKLHTGRSRNDQVATDTRLWALGALDAVDGLVADLQRALLAQAESNADTVMPSYTHLQRAQPISAAHWLLSHAWALVRDRERIRGARERVSVLPLGSGAIAGCPFPIDRELLRDRLGFGAISRNSIDAVGDRDWVAEILFAAATLGAHLSRLAEDLILFTSAEFGFVRLSDTYSTGSSLMPQKRNPDAMELARGKAARLIGGLVGTLTLLKGLPTGYNKDLQEDKETLFDAVDTLTTLLPAVTGSVATMTLDADRTMAAIDAAMLATDLADFLVRAGVPFRDAHERVGRLVRAAEELGCSLSELPHERFVGVAPEFQTANLKELFDPRRSLEARSVSGGTGKSALQEQMTALKTLI
jgi:argininosuccinate lyase